MNYPTFSKTGDINMSEVIDAKISDFIPDLDPKFILKELSDFIDFIRSCKPYCGDNYFHSKGYNKLLSDYIYDKLTENETPEGRARTAGYTHSSQYCLWYNIYCTMIHANAFHHCSEKDNYSFHIDLLEKMIYDSIFLDKINAV